MQFFSTKYNDLVQDDRKALLLIMACSLTLKLGLALDTGALPDDVWIRLHEKFGYYFILNLFDNYQQIYQHLKTVEFQFRGGQWTNDFFEFARHQMLLVYMVGLIHLLLRPCSRFYWFPLFSVSL